jgi:drug/metabolite transporter (DMT)-like permease
MLSVTLSIISALVFALYGVLGKKLTYRCGGLAVTCGSFIFGSAELLIIILLGYIPSVQGFYGSLGLDMFSGVPLLSGINLTTLPYFLFICVVNSAAGYVCHMMAIEKTGATTASLIFFFKPIIAPVIALAVLGEAITNNMVFGIAFFLAGSLCGIVPRMLNERRARALEAECEMRTDL